MVRIPGTRPTVAAWDFGLQKIVILGGLLTLPGKCIFRINLDPLSRLRSRGHGFLVFWCPLPGAVLF